MLNDERSPLPHLSSTQYKPSDYTDSGNAALFVSTYRNKAIFVRSFGWLIWTGKVWKADDLGAVALAINLSKKMLTEALDALSTARKELTSAQGLQDLISIERAKQAVQRASDFLKHAHRTRSAPGLNRMLELSRPALQVELDQLDSDPFYLNTPSGIVDLSSGKISPHDPTKLCASITEVSPDNGGFQLWHGFLQTVTCGDKNLEDFLQMVVGMAVWGKVFVESIIIAYGGGANGKSTFFNAVARVLGSYATSIVPEILTTSRRNKGANFAELKGKRLVLAAELEEDARLSTSTLKQLASTDRISAERKYCDPESFIPSHSLVLFTNHLPKVGSADNGTWRRIIAIEFCAVIQPQADIKNFADILYTKAGGAILQWVLDGAKRFCNNGFSLSVPLCVQATTNKYKSDSNTITQFFDECCEIGTSKSAKAGELYRAYREWAERNGEQTKHSKEFATALRLNGFTDKRKKDGCYWYGLSIL
jgi:P4 family phage/plasmid primase-like protien